jgi:hypothetical protein
MNSLWKRSAGDAVTGEFYDSRKLHWESQVTTGSQIQKRILITNSVLAEEHFMAAWTYHKTVCGVSYTLWIAIIQCEDITSARRPSSTHHTIILSKFI